LVLEHSESTKHSPERYEAVISQLSLFCTEPVTNVTGFCVLLDYL
jgi:hypothetical protein